METVGEIVEARGLAIALGIGTPKVALDALGGRTAALMADDCDWLGV